MTTHTKNDIKFVFEAQKPKMKELWDNEDDEEWEKIGG